MMEVLEPRIIAKTVSQRSRDVLLTVVGTEVQSAMRSAIGFKSREISSFDGEEQAVFKPTSLEGPVVSQSSRWPRSRVGRSRDDSIQGWVAYHHNGLISN